MNDTTIITILCPMCGQHLVGPSGKAAAQLSDTIRCPVHGDMGRFEDAVKKVGQDFMAQTHKQVGEELEKIAKQTGFTFTKE